MRALRFFGYALTGLLLLAQTGLALTMTVAHATDHTFLIITGGSMEPTYHLGSALILKDVDPDEVTPGDPVTFKSVEGVLTTHRVISLHTIDGRQFVRTQGDANAEPDPNFALTESIVGTPVHHIPYAGMAASFLLSPLGRFFVFGPPLALLALVEIGIVRACLRERRARANAEADAPTSGWVVPTAIVGLLVVSTATGVSAARSTATFVATSTASANTMRADTLDPPTNFDANKTGPKANTLTWTRTSDPYATGYEVYRADTANGTFTLIATVAGQTTETYEDNPISGKRYYKVRAVSGGWASVYTLTVSP